MSAAVCDEGPDVPGCYHGHCFCGDVRFTVAGDVVPNTALYCHCESCRRAHAAPLYQIVYIPVESFNIIAGEELIKAYSKSDGAVARSFCQQCGSKIHNVVTPKPSLGIGFFPALLDEDVQHNLPDIFKPHCHYLSNDSVLSLHEWHDGLVRE